jgi:hypothetical protein
MSIKNLTQNTLKQATHKENFEDRSFDTKLKSDRSNIQPADPIAREFIAPFCEQLYRTIEKPSSGGNWTTNTKYPLSPYQLWEKHQDHSCFIGVRHGNSTYHAALDIDKNSPYHPDQDETALDRIKAALESIGLVRSVNTRSSDSGGLHIWFSLPEKVNTFKLACAIATTLLKAGFVIGKGKLEVFPNIKPYSPNPLEPTYYNGLRLPLQQGSYILDDNLNPISDDIKLWVSMWKTTAAGQDIKLLQRSLKKAKKPKDITGKNIKGNAAKWLKDLKSILNNGFELDGTQNMLYTISLIHYVFDGITDRAELAKAIAATARNTKGFWEYSQHTHEIEKCSRNWAKWIINNPKYYPYDSGKAIATATTKEPKTSRLDEVKQGLINLFAEIGDRTFRTTTLALEYLRKQLKTSPNTLYRLQELWQHLVNNCNVASSNKYSDFNLENSETCEKVVNAETFIESDITVTAPNELLGAESYPQKIIDPVISELPAAPIFWEKSSEPIQANDFQPIMTFDQQLAIARICPSSPMPESSNRRSPKEPPRPNPSTLENIQAIVTADPSKAGSQLAMLQAKLFLPWLKSEERSQTEAAITWLKKFLESDRTRAIATDEHLQNC